MRAWIQSRLGEIALAVLVFGQVLAVGHQVTDESGQPLLRYWSGAVLVPLQSGVHAVAGPARQLLGHYFWTVGAGEENRELEAQAARLRMENHFLRQELLRYETLETLDAFRSRLASETLSASVIGQEPSRPAKEIYLDRGSDHGVEPGMAVLIPAGIVGRIVAVHRRSSLVVLINDPESGAGVLLADSGAPGVLRGAGADGCRIDYIGSSVRVPTGDFVYTSGLDGIFPRGLPVGRVSAASDDADARDIRVEPFADLAALREVLVVIGPTHESLPARVRQSIADAHRPSRDRSGQARDGPVLTQADLVKRAYRLAVESQRTQVGALSYSGPPDFTDAVLRASPEDPE